MADQKVQNVANHARIVPAFHLFVGPVLMINVIYHIYLVRFSHSIGTLWQIVVAVALLVLAFSARIFALTVQDRVIRLEMRMRLAELLSMDLRPRIPEFTVAQLVSLRFASDSELPALARKVLDEKLTERKAIKQLIQNWRPDNLRA